MKYCEVKEKDVNHLKLSSQVMIAEEVPIFHTIYQSGWWVGTCFFKVAELLKMPMVVSHKIFLCVKHLVLNKSSKCFIREIKHEPLLQKKNTYGLGLTYM